MTLNKKNKTKTKTLASIITNSKIKKLAGDKFYERGLGYFQTGVVENLVDFENRISAQVWGRYKYNVYFRIEHNRFCYRCDCPVGDEGHFCKHCVATALEWIDSHKPKSKKSCDLPDEISLDQVFKCLMNEDKEKLARIIIDQARLNPGLSRQLKLGSSVIINGKVDIEFFKNEISKAFENFHYSDGFDENKYVNDLHEIVDLLEELPSEYGNEFNELVKYMLTEADSEEFEGLATGYLFEELMERLFEIGG